MDIFKKQYIESKEAGSLTKVSFKKNRQYKSPKWTDSTESSDRKFEILTRELYLKLGAKYINFKSFEFDLKAYELPTERGRFQSDSISIHFYNNKYFMLIGECKYTKTETGSSSVPNGAFEKIQLYRNVVKERIKEIFKVKVIPIFLIHTKNFNISKKKKLTFIKGSDNYEKVISITESEHEYLSNCYTDSKNSDFVFNQFLGMFCSTRKLFNTVKVGGFTTATNFDQSNKAYTISVKVKDLIPISYVAHRRGKSTYSDSQITNILEESSSNYQRILSSRRINKISKFLVEKKQSFVNNILVSFRGRPRDLKFISHDKIGQGRTGEVSISGKPGSLHVIDGQHRLFGYLGVENKQILEEEIIVTILYEMTQLEEAVRFLDINREQAKVDISLLREVQLLLGESAVGKMQVQNLATSIALELRERDNSPFNSPKAIPASESGGALPLEQMRKALMTGKLISSRDEFIKGFLSYKDDFRETSDFSTNLLINFFNKIRRSTEKYWILPTSKNKNVTLRTNFICGSILVLERFINEASKSSSLSVDEIETEIEKYVNDYCEGLKKITTKQVRLLFAWPKGEGTVEGGAKYPLARYHLLNELMSEGFKDKLIYDEDLDLIPKEEEKDIFDLISRLSDKNKSAQVRASAYEVPFSTSMHKLMTILFGDNYWSEICGSHILRKVVFNPAAEKKDQKLKSKFVNLNTEERDAVYKNDIDWSDWAQYRDLIKGLIADKDDYFQGKCQLNVNLKEKMKEIFFVHDPSFTNFPQGVDQGLTWIELIDFTSGPDAHKRKENILNPSLEKSYWEMEEGMHDVVRRINKFIEENDDQ